MQLNFQAKIKQAAIKVPKPSDADPSPEPFTVLTLEADLSPIEVAQLMRMMPTGITVVLSTDQLGFDVEQSDEGQPAFVAEAREALVR